jgi:hypothetical protein
MRVRWQRELSGDGGLGRGSLMRMTPRDRSLGRGTGVPPVMGRSKVPLRRHRKVPVPLAATSPLALSVAVTLSVCAG